MSASRRFACWVAWNVDGSPSKKLGRKGIDFVTDPDYEPIHQVDDTPYSRNPLDRVATSRAARTWSGEE